MSRRIVVTMTTTQRNRINNALADIRSIYAELEAAWPELRRRQRRQVLQHSPILREIKRSTKWLWEPRLQDEVE